MKMRGQSMGAAGLLPRSPSLTGLSTGENNRVVEIESESYEVRTNSAAFEGGVRVKEMTGEELKGKMSCGQMTVTFAGTNELQQMVAQNDVVIEQDTARFTAGKAVYSGDTGVLELTDRPAWRAAAREGQGDVLLMNVRKNELVARGNASMRLPADELGKSFGSSPDAAPAIQSQSASNQLARIFSDEYSLEPEAALFQGNVRVDHPRTKLVCEQMTVALGSGNDKTRRVVAERSVVFDLTGDKGETMHGRAQKAVYTYSVTPAATNDLVELTGDPSLVTTNGTFRNKIIILDRAHNKLLAPGRYQMHGLAAAGTTNTFQWPKKSAK
jgi:lipopolysaccharide export system protein LptA